MAFAFTVALFGCGGSPSAARVAPSRQRMHRRLSCGVLHTQQLQSWRELGDANFWSTLASDASAQKRTKRSRMAQATNRSGSQPARSVAAPSSTSRGIAAPCWRPRPLSSRAAYPAAGAEGVQHGGRAWRQQQSAKLALFRRRLRERRGRRKRGNARRSARAGARRAEFLDNLPAV